MANGAVVHLPAVRIMPAETTYARLMDVAPPRNNGRCKHRYVLVCECCGHRELIRKSPAGRRRLPISREKIVALKKQGMSLRQIAQEFGVGRMTIKRRLESRRG